MKLKAGAVAMLVVAVAVLGLGIYSGVANGNWGLTVKSGFASVAAFGIASGLLAKYRARKWATSMRGGGK